MRRGNIFFRCSGRGILSSRKSNMLFNATFKNISAIPWRSVLLVKETGVEYLEKTIDLSQVTDKLYHIM